MMNVKLAVVLIITVGLISALVYNNIVRQKDLRQVALAQELHKAMGAMMGDLRQGKAGSVKGVPADGQWHHEIVFNTLSNGDVQYHLSGASENDLNRISGGKSQTIAAHIGVLNLRRQIEDDAVIEVQLQARNMLSLTSNFRIRMQE